VVNELVAKCGLERPEGRRRLNAAGQKAVGATAERLAQMVDQALSKEGGTTTETEVTATAPHGEEREVGCSCGSGVAVAKLDIGGKTVELAALPLIFQKFRKAGRPLDEAADELFATVKIYNAVPPEAEASCREAVLREYAAFCQKEKKP
jgi:hypothetical protein